MRRDGCSAVAVQKYVHVIEAGDVTNVSTIICINSKRFECPSSTLAFQFCVISMCIAHHQTTLHNPRAAFPSPSQQGPLAINHHTSIRMQTLPSNHTAVLTSQENKARRNLRRLCRPPHRRSTQLVLSLFRHGGGDERGPDRAGADGVDADAVGDLLVVQAAGEGDDGAFGGGVVEEVGAADVGVDGGAVDDGVAAVHVREGVLGEVEVGVDVGVEGFEPLVSVCRNPHISIYPALLESGKGASAYSESSPMLAIMF